MLELLNNLSYDNSLYLLTLHWRPPTKEFQAGIVKHPPSERDILVYGPLSGQRPLFHNTETKSRDLKMRRKHD